MTFVLKVPHYLLDSIAAHGRNEHPREACGFLCGRKGGYPNRFVPIKNVHASPERYYTMGEMDAILAFGVMDELKQDPLAIYHSHPNSDAEMSTTDINAAWDLDAIYIICSMQKSKTQPIFRAWKIIEDESGREVEEVALDIIDEAHPDSQLHGLVEGNRVRITWDGEAGRRTTVALVGPRADEGESVTIYPERPGLGGAVVRIGLDRIRACGILAEGTNYAHARAQAASFLSEASLRLAAGDTLGARNAIERAGLVMPRVIPAPPPIPRAYRPLRGSEK